MPKDAKTLTEFANFQQTYLVQHIQMADAKAGVVIAASGTLIGFLVSSPAFSKALGFSSPSALIAAAALVLLALSFALACSVVRPRGVKPSGFLYFAAVAAFDNAAAYRERIGELSEAELADARVEQCYALSKICADKYAALRWSMILGLFGAIATGLVVRLLAL